MITPIQQINPDMIVLTRESRGLTQGDLAKVTGISQSAVSKYENGMIEVSPDHRRIIASALGYPEELFFQWDLTYAQGSACMYHRKRVSIPAKSLTTIHAMVNLKQGQIQNLLRSVSIPENQFRRFDISEHESPKEIARLVRHSWRLPAGPIKNLVGAIERSGGIVALCHFGTRKLDGMSRWSQSTPPIFFVNREMPWDRCRWTLAHEIGHMIMHQSANPDQENQADEFASEFLMPEGDIRPHLRNFTLGRAAELKPIWRVSMQALIRKAHALNELSDRQYRIMFTKIGKMGYRTLEPYPIADEQPQTIESVIDLHLNEHGYSIPEMSRLTFLNADEFQQEYLPRRIRIHSQQ